MVDQGILAEIEGEYDRRRTVLGIAAEDDDQLSDGELSLAAACHAYAAARPDDKKTIENLWPNSMDRPQSTVKYRELVMAAALIIAEIERIERAMRNMKGKP